MSPDASPPRYRYLVFALLALAYLMVYFHRIGTGVVSVDLEKDLAADPSLLGLLGAAYFWPYALMQLPSGLLSDSWGPRRTITVSFILAGAAAIFFGLAQSVGMAIFARVLVGIGLALLFVPTLKIMTRWFKVTEFARMTGILMAVGGLGVLSAAGPLAEASAAFGWRASFIGMGVFTLVLAAAIWFLVRNTPEEMGFPPVEEAPATPPPAIGLWQGVRLVLTSRRFWPLATWFFFACGIFFGFAGVWGNHYLHYVYGLNKTQAGSVLNMLAVAMIVGSPILSWVSERLRSRKKVLIGSSVVLVGVTLQLAFWPAALSHAMLYVMTLLLSLSASAIVVVSFTSGKELFPVAMAGTATGLVNLFPFLGGAVFQWLVGRVLEAQGLGYTAEAFGNAFLLFVGASVIALIASLFCRESYGGVAQA